MDAFLYATLRQRELLADAERMRIGRLAALARHCRDAYRPGPVRQLLARLGARPLAPAAC